MKEKTNFKTYVPWLIALSAAFFIYLAAKYFSLAVLLVPINQAVGITTVQAINEFGSGTPGTESFWLERLSMLGSLVLVFVMGPVLWLAGSKSANHSKSVMWYAGVTLVMIGFINVTNGLVNHVLITGDRWETAERSRNTDQVRSELSTLNNRALELYWLPKEEGGADHDVSAISLSDLKENGSFENIYLLEKSSLDSTFTIYGIGREEGDRSEFQNANGETGKVQLVAKVDPQKLETEWLRADSLKN